MKIESGDAEKPEDLRDVRDIKRLKEGEPSDYFSGDQITSMYKA